MNSHCHSCGGSRNICRIFSERGWRCFYCGVMWKDEKMEIKLEKLESIISRFEILDIRE